MLIKTNIPLHQTVSINDFFHFVSTWGLKSGNMLDAISFNEENADIYLVYRRGKTIVSVFYDTDNQIAAVQINRNKAQGLYRCWEYMFDKQKGQLLIKFEDNMGYTKRESRLTKPFSAPGIIRTVIDSGLCYTPADCLPITSFPLSINEENKGLVSSYMLRVLTPVTKGWSENLKPVIYIPINGVRKKPIAVKAFSNRLKGIAHVVYPESRKIHKYIKKHASIRLKNNKITVIYPTVVSEQLSSKVQCFPLPTSMSSMNKLFLQIVDLAKASTFSNQYSIEYLREDILKRKIRNLKEAYDIELRSRIAAEKQILFMRESEIHIREEIAEKVMSEAEEIVESYESDIADLRNTNYEIEMKYHGLETENMRLRNRLKNPDQIPALFYGKEKEFYLGEIPDLLMSVLEDSLVSIPENSRKHDIVKDVLSANGFKHIGHIRNEKIKTLLKSYTGMTSKIRGGLEDLGFHIEEKSGHYKVTYFGDSRYLAILGSTPSDVRSGKNNAALIARIAY